MGDRLKEKVALVSGAGSSGPGWGNGKATAALFGREGAKVLAVDLNLDAAVETKRIIESEGGICEVVAGNVSRADDVATNSRRLHHGVWADRRTAQQCRHC
jgi:NAD(P)-dependent dehydrogenase (short-subunit alcohol dehydrogenase family)